jgi:uncharacterized protein (DUF58 family)
VLRVIGEILAFKPKSRGTDLAKGLDFLGKVAKRRSVVFFVSDFFSVGWERAMRIASQRHEIVPVVVGDPMETTLPNVGLLVLEDLETGAVIEVDTSRGMRRDFEAQALRAAEEREQALRRLNLDVVTVTTDQPYVDALIAFFRARVKRMAHG